MILSLTTSSSRFDNILIKPAKQVSATSGMFEAQRPMACIVAAETSLSELATYVYNKIISP